MSGGPKIAVIGGGPGGYSAAIRAAQRGANVILFEKEHIGGVCLNRGCIPSKALIEGAKNFHIAATVAKTAGAAPFEAQPAWVRAQKHKESVVSRLRKGIEFLLKKHKITMKKGSGRLLTPKKVEFTGRDGSEAFDVDGAILATGSVAAIIPGLEPDGDRVLDSDGILALQTMPASLAVIGGGAIGVEWASLFASFGVKVNVVEIMDQLVPGADPDAAKELTRGFKKRKIGVHTGVKVNELVRGADGVTLNLSNGKAIQAEKALVSVGRRPFSEGALDESVGVETDRGGIPVDSRTQTNVPGVHAIGDVTGQILLAHYAAYQGMVAAENLTGGDRTVDRSAVPGCIFTEPEVAWVGHTPATAQEAGIDVETGDFPFRALGRAHAADELWGFVKILAEKGSGKVVGYHAVGPRATDLVAQGAIAVRWGLTAHQIEETIHAHPTFAEASAEAAADVFGMAVNK